MPEISAAVRGLPKVQLHCHLEGTVRAATFRELAGRYGVESARAAGPPDETYAFANFREFLLTFAEVCKTLRTPDDYARIARDYAADALGQNVRYAEVFISPSVWTFFHQDLDVTEAVAAMRAAFDEARPRGLEVAFICDLTRNFGVERAQRTAEIAVGLAEAGLGVVGVGLGGDEANYPARDYRGPFDYARAHGLHCVAHAGEAAGPESVWQAIDDLAAERIGHGVRALEDPSLVATLAERRITLECCPTSNHLTGAVPPTQPHPIAAFARAGVPCAIDADDPALFSTTLNDEYALAETWLGWDGLVDRAHDAVEASFLANPTKVVLHENIDVFCTDIARGVPN
jgi:aminodeoxyfutalosine deaminase